jgi:Ca-activated chloride channel family protein
METQFFNLNHPEALQWLWLLAIPAVLFGLNLRRRQKAVALFVSKSLLDDVCPRRSFWRPVVRFAVLLAGLVCLIVAAAQPRWDPKQIEMPQQGQNLLFCLDVSNSMRARDVDPSRLEAAKAAVRSLVMRLPAGNQVGLLAYAGSSELKCPLTPNYSHFLSVLQQVTFNSVDEGGTDLGDAIHDAVKKVFGLDPDQAASDKKTATQPATQLKAEQPEGQRNADVLVVLTDGENHEGHAKDMAALAHRLGVGVYIIGLGTAAGAPIPIEVDGKTTTLKFKDQEVITKFDDASLRSVVADLPNRCGYLAAGASNVDLVDIYNNVIAKQDKRTKDIRVTVWQEKFQLFVGMGLVLVVLSTLISEQRPAPRVGGAR